jgi:hypothetical protein
MGSHNAQTTTYWWADKTLVVCGCWHGTVDEFKARVKSVHGENEHGQTYAKYINRVEMLIKSESEEPPK